MFDTLNLTPGHRRALEGEMLGKIRDHGPATVAELFWGFKPRWAVEAARRLVALGRVREGVGGRLEVVAAVGRPVA